MLWCLIFVAGFSVQPVAAVTAPSNVYPVPSQRQLRGLSEAEAAALIAKLEDAQRRLKAGEPQYFELLTGAVASPEVLRLSPRDAFLQVPFKEVWNVERVGPADKLFQHYRLSYAPNGLGQLYWEIEVNVMFQKRVTRIEMTYKSPAPF